MDYEPIYSGKTHVQSPTIYITPEAKTRLDYYIESSSIEISGLGTVKKYKGDLLIEKILLFEQKCDAVNTDLTSSDVAKYLYQAIKEGIDPSEIKLWWHSHHKMGCFWSEKDQYTIESFGRTSDWFLSIVGCHGGQYLCSLDLFKPLRITVPTLLVIVPSPIDTVLLNKIKSEIAQKVTVVKKTLKEDEICQSQV